MSDSSPTITAVEFEGDRLKVPPHSIQSEQSVLGGLLLDNEAWDQIADLICEEDFYRRDHRHIFRAIGQIIEQGNPCDVITLSESLDKQGKLDESGGLAYLGALAKDTPSAANIRAYASIVRENSVLRQLAQVGTDIANSAYMPEGRDTAELLDHAEQKVFHITDQGGGRGSGFENIKDLLSRAVDRIDTLFHQDSPITGIPTGFTDIDEMTAGLQQSDLVIVAGRPSMGKCIVSGSRILDPCTGQLRTIDDMVKRGDGRLLTLDNNKKFQSAIPSAYVDDGIKPVFRVRTALGREINTTLTHPFLGVEGWRPLGEMSEGDYIAVPRALPCFGDAVLPEYKVKLIAYFLTDGGLTQTNPRFTNKNTRLREDFTDSVHCFPGVATRVFDSNGTRIPSVGVSGDQSFIKQARMHFAGFIRTRMQELSLSLTAMARELGVAVNTVCYWTKGAAVPEASMMSRIAELLDVPLKRLAPQGVSAMRSNSKNPVTEWLADIGLMDKDAHGKSIPAVVFGLKEDLVALLLNRMFACDGSVYVQNKDQACASYASVSYQMTRDVQHLLLRFGIIAKLRHRQIKYGSQRRAAYELRITAQDSVRRLIERIGVFSKEAACESVLSISRSKQSKVNIDVLPAAFWKLITEKMGDMSWKELARRLGKKPDGCNFHVGKRGISRHRLAEIADVLDDDELRKLAQSDIYWDTIESIEYVGDKQVYDLTVPETHNFIAEDVLVHNTTFAMNIAEHVAIKHKITTAVFSMEMPGDQLAMRMMSSLGRIDQHKVRTGKLSDDDWPRLTSAVSILAESPLFIDDTPALSPTELRARARRLKREHDLGLIIIDYLQLMQVPGSKENRTTEISEISRSLKALAKELSVPVIALSQLNRSLEQRPNKRPVMSDLRECVTGDTRVVCTDGRRIPIKQMIGMTPEVFAMDKNGRIVKATSDKIWLVGEKPVLKVSLASGREIRVTREHQMFTDAGWQKSGSLNTGDRLALARKIPQPSRTVNWTDQCVALLGQLIGDGSYLKGQPLRYTTQSPENSELVKTAAVQAFGATVNRHESNGSWHQLVISGNGNRWKPQGVNKWLRELGIFNQRSHEKQVPDIAFSLPDRQVAILLSHLWATDGTIYTRPEHSKGSHVIHYSTNSSRLASDVSALLQRLGIIARIKKTQKADYKPGYLICITGAEMQRLFLETVPAFGPRIEQANRLAATLKNVKANTNVDTLPDSLFIYIREKMAEKGISHRKMAAMRGTAYGGSSHFSFSPSREVIGHYAELLEDDYLRGQANNELFWDRVVAVEDAGVEDVYDITVPGPASWLADGIVTHNSGAIEQDADVIMFIYRDEVYNSESPDKGSAEIIIGKQRNGPIGTRRLTFLGQHTRFENFTAVSYADEDFG